MAKKNPSFSERLKHLYKESGCKNEAIFAREIGLNYTTIRKYLRQDGTVPEWPQLLSISEHTGRSVEWLLTGKEISEINRPAPEWTISPEARDKYPFLRTIVSEINEAAEKNYSAIELGDVLIETLKVAVKKLEIEKKSKGKKSAANSG